MTHPDDYFPGPRVCEREFTVTLVQTAPCGYEYPTPEDSEWITCPSCLYEHMLCDVEDFSQDEGGDTLPFGALNCHACGAEIEWGLEIPEPRFNTRLVAIPNNVLTLPKEANNGEGEDEKN